MTKKFRPGFGVIEVLISGVIISVVLGATVSTGNMAIRINRQTTEKTQATLLAQEALELMRQNRDTNWIDEKNSSRWDALQDNETEVLNSMGASNSLLGYISFSPTEGNYTFKSDSSRSESFTFDGITYNRQVEIRKVGNLLPDSTEPGTGSIYKDSNGLVVNAIVTWASGAKRVEVAEVLTNWRPNF